MAATKLAVDAWDKMMCEAAVKNGFTCVDIYHSFNGPDGLQAAGDLLAADYTHPSQAGNDRIAELLAAEGYDAALALTAHSPASRDGTLHQSRSS